VLGEICSDLWGKDRYKFSLDFVLLIALIGVNRILLLLLALMNLLPNSPLYSHYPVFDPGRQAEAQVEQTLLFVVSRHTLLAVAMAGDALPQAHALALPDGYDDGIVILDA